MTQTRVNKTYQSATPNYQMVMDNDQNPTEGITVGVGRVSFIPKVERLTNLIFGEFNSGNPQVLEQFLVTIEDERTGKVTSRKITPVELEAMIENSKAFKSCQKDKTMGVRGVWPKPDRETWLKEQAGTPQAADPTSVYSRQSDAVLKLMLDERKVAYAAESTHEQLVALVVKSE